MIIVKLFTVVNQFGILVETSAPDQASSAVWGNPTILHLSYEPLEDIYEGDHLYESVTKALKYADGYAGDLRDHIER